MVKLKRPVVFAGQDFVNIMLDEYLARYVLEISANIWNTT
jgi:hypothetical protein